MNLYHSYLFTFTDSQAKSVGINTLFLSSPWKSACFHDNFGDHLFHYLYVYVCCIFFIYYGRYISFIKIDLIYWNKLNYEGYTQGHLQQAYTSL